MFKMIGKAVSLVFIGHVLESKFDVLAKIGNGVGKIPFIGNTVEDLWEKLLE